jgi:hypothetical protein
MTDVPATPKTLGDYGVEADKAMADNNTNGVSTVTAEMRAAAPPLPPEPKEGRLAVPPPPPVDLGLRGFADALDAAAAANNVATARKLTADMIALEPPTPPAPETRNPAY